MKSEPVFLLAGQSNMAGRCQASALPQELLLNDENCTTFTLCWSNDSNFGPDCESQSSGEFRSLQCQESPGLGASLFGPEMGIQQTLGKRLAFQGISQAHFLKFAMGSTNLSHHWNPQNDSTSTSPSKKAHYPRFIEYCRAVLKENPSMKLSGLFWLQGESDSSQSKTAKSYAKNLETFIDAVRRDLKVPNLPVVMSPVVWKGKHVDLVNRALQDAGRGGISNCVCIEPIDEMKMGVPILQGKEATTGCEGHLTAEAVLDVGRRMGTAFPLDSIVLDEFIDNNAPK